MEYVIYCRRSSDEKSEKQTQSIPDQITRCLEFAKTNGLTIKLKPQDFSDFETDDDILKEDNDSDLNNRRIYKSTRDLFIIKESKTGKTPYVRKKRRKLMGYIKSGTVKGLLSYSPDRQARNILEGGELINFVDEEKIDLKYTNFHFENTASGKMMLGVWFVFAKQYSDAISENVLRGNDETVGRGKALSAPKYGYYRDPEDGYYKPDKETFELIKEAFRMKIYDQKSDTQISDRLNDRGWTKKRGTKNILATPNKVNKMRKDTFYYGLFCVADRISDQTQDNPYFSPMITKEEYEMLADRREDKKTPIALKQIKDEYAEISLVPRNMLKAIDGYGLTPNLPNKKKRFLPKLKELQKNNPQATLKDVVSLHQIRYSVKQKLSKYCGVEITGTDIEKAVITKFRSLKTNAETYNEYVAFMKDKLQEVYDQTTEEMNVLTMRINNVRSEMIKYIDRHMGLPKDKMEEEIYQNKKKEYEAKIFRLEKERNELGSTERSIIMECEMFMDTMNRADNYYKRASYVQKAKLCEIFFLNMILDDKKRLHIAVKPVFEKFFISDGADDETRTRGLFLGKEPL